MIKTSDVVLLETKHSVLAVPVGGAPLQHSKEPERTHIAAVLRLGGPRSTSHTAAFSLCMMSPGLPVLQKKEVMVRTR